jgi:hypothetical protein
MNETGTQNRSVERVWQVLIYLEFFKCNCKLTMTINTFGRDVRQAKSRSPEWTLMERSVGSYGPQVWSQSFPSARASFEWSYIFKLRSFNKLIDF